MSSWCKNNTKGTTHDYIDITKSMVQDIIAG